LESTITNCIEYKEKGSLVLQQFNTWLCQIHTEKKPYLDSCKEPYEKEHLNDPNIQAQYRATLEAIKANVDHASYIERFNNSLRESGNEQCIDENLHAAFQENKFDVVNHCHSIIRDAYPEAIYQACLGEQNQSHDEI